MSRLLHCNHRHPPFHRGDRIIGVDALGGSEKEESLHEAPVDIWGMNAFACLHLSSLIGIAHLKMDFHCARRLYR
jgi:hypothetical protein